MNDVQKTTETQSPPRVRPATDIVEREDGFHIFMDLPGVKKEDLILDLKENQIVVRGVARYACGAEEKSVEMEFGSGEYVRAFTLADVVDRERIKAVMENGVLEIHLPKVEKSAPKRIEISRGQQGIEKVQSVSLLQKVQTIAYGEYASVLNFSCASHLTLFERPAENILLTIS